MNSNVFLIKVIRGRAKTVQTSRVQYPWDPFFGTPFGAKGGRGENIEGRTTSV